MIDSSVFCCCYAGFAVAFFGALAASGQPEQQAAFCRSMADAWDAAQYQPAPSFKDKIPFFGRKGKPPVAPDDFTCTLCLCLTAFGPGALAQVQYSSEIIGIFPDCAAVLSIYQSGDASCQVVSVRLGLYWCQHS